MPVDSTKYIRDIVIDSISDRLKLITLANGYDFEVNEKVFTLAGIVTDVPLPAIMLMETNENALNRTGWLYSCDLNLTIVAAAVYHGADPDGECRKLLGNIQRAVVVPQPEVYFAAIKYNADPLVLTEDTSVAQVIEIGNAMNAGEAIEGQVVCQIEVTVKYDRALQDPRRIL